MRLAVVLALLAVVVPAAAGAAGNAGRGRALVEKAECNRCHAIASIAEPPREASCVSCHLWIMSTAADPAATAEAKRSFPLWDRHVERVKAGHFTQGTPSLRSVGRRLRPEWVRAFLLDPYDVRPNLSESMIRSAFRGQDLDDVLAFLLADAEKLAPGPLPPADPALVAKGATLFEQRGCAACHLFGNRRFPAAGPAQLAFQPFGPRALAPDLRHARDRFRPEALVAWIRDPKALKPDTTMPPLQLTAEEGLAVAAFVLHGDPGPGPTAPAPAPARAPAVAAWKGPATFRQVDDRVLSRVCIHCHMDPDTNAGDGGPGNTGGFGYAPVGLSFGSYRSLLKGSVGPDGKRLSVFRPGPSGEPVLIEVLKRRYPENGRDRILPGHDDLGDRKRDPPTEAPGMPMGLPAIAPEDLALVEAWVRAGHPGPPPGDDGVSAYYGPSAGTR